MELTLTLSKHQVYLLTNDFTEYSHRTGEIRIFPWEGGTKIIFYKRDMGIQWYITPMGKYGDNHYILIVKINPKILGGEIDYITASTNSDMGCAIVNFNKISTEISPLLQNFNCYTIRRIDYCINFFIDELAPECTTEQIMYLIKHSNIPPFYDEWQTYSDKEHRMKSNPNSFYLINRFSVINCYLKYKEMLERFIENQKKGYPPIPLEALEKSKYVIRFEVQCMRRKVYVLLKNAEKNGFYGADRYKYLVSPIVCEEIITQYFLETVGGGDWFTLSDAIKQVYSHNFNQQKRERLVKALQVVNKCRSVSKAKELYQDKELEYFKRTLKYLSSLGINPVTIPQSWGIQKIPNLLDNFFNQLPLSFWDKDSQCHKYSPLDYRTIKNNLNIL